MNEITIREDVKVSSGSFEIRDFNKVKEYLVSILPDYTMDVVNKDNLKEAKDNRALLNKLSKTLNNRRIDAQKSYMEGFNGGKKQYDELIDLINKAADKLGEQINSVEDAEKTKDKALLQDYFNSVNIYPITFEQVFNAKWLTKKTGLENAKNEIDSIMFNTNNCVNALKQAVSDSTLELALMYYFDCLDLQEALNKAKVTEDKLTKVREFLKQ